MLKDIQDSHRINRHIKAEMEKARKEDDEIKTDEEKVTNNTMFFSCSVNYLHYCH